MRRYRRVIVFLAFTLIWIVWHFVQIQLNTTLLWAIVANDSDQVRRLLNWGASPNAPDVMTMPRWSLQDELALWYGRLTNQHARERPIHLKYTALMRAVQYADGKMVSLLIERGADVNAQDLAGRTALNWAIRDNRQEAIALLIQAQANHF